MLGNDSNQQCRMAIPQHLTANVLFYSVPTWRDNSSSCRLVAEQPASAQKCAHRPDCKLEYAIQQSWFLSATGSSAETREVRISFNFLRPAPRDLRRAMALIISACGDYRSHPNVSVCDRYIPRSPRGLSQADGNRVHRLRV